MCNPAPTGERDTPNKGEGKWKNADDSTPGPLPADRPMTASQAAGYMGVTERFVRKLIETRQITYLKIGRLVRLQSCDLDAYLAACRVAASQRPPRSPGRSC